MSDLERLEDETNSEATVVLPEPNEGTSSGSDGDRAPAAVGENGQAPAKKKRRRGSRGGRNRKKPAGGAAAAGGKGPQMRTGAKPDEPTKTRTEDWTDETADRGLTDDDIAEQAKEDA